MSSIFNFNFIYLSTHYIFTAAAALPPPLELFAPAVFEVGDLVQSIPDTTPGVHPRHSVAIVGAVTELKLDGGWMYVCMYVYVYICTSGTEPHVGAPPPNLTVCLSVFQSLSLLVCLCAFFPSCLPLSLPGRLPTCLHLHSHTNTLTRCTAHSSTHITPLPTLKSQRPYVPVHALMFHSFILIFNAQV